MRFVSAWLVLACLVHPWLGAAAPAESTPEVSLSLRGAGDGSIEVGEPFRVAVRVGVSGNKSPDAALRLAPATGSWIDATSVEILAGDGQPLPIRARPAPQTALQVTVVDAENPATGLWWFPRPTLQSLAPGDYLVRVRLAIRDGSGWKGEVVSESWPLRLISPSSDPERVTQRHLARAHAAILAREPAKAAEILDAALATTPDNVPVLALRAALSLEGGDRHAARICLDRAMVLAAQAGGEPSAELHDLAQRIELALTDDSAPRVAAAWAQLPRSFYEPDRVGPSNPNPISSAPAASPTPTDPLPASASGVAPSPSSSPVLSIDSGEASSPTPPVAATAPQALGTVVPAAELVDAAIIADENGQWAESAKASSEYGSPRYGAVQATGAPNIPLGLAGDNPEAWCPASKNDGTAWLELTFAKPVHATAVRVRQNNAPGAIARIEVIDADGATHLWWEGIDPFVAPRIREIAWFAVRLPRTEYLVAKVKITINLAAVEGWKQIDAVQLVGSAP